MEKGRYFKKVYFDRQILLIAAVVSLMVLYYINPLENTVLETWDRTFCDAMVGGGVSIAKRIRNFYICYVFLPPLFMAFFSVLAGGILQGRAEYKKAFVMMDTVLVPALAAAYVSRHSLGSQAVADNPVLITAMIYQMLMLCAGLFDREGILTAGRLVFLYISYMVSAVAAVLLVPGMGINKSAIIAGSLFLVLLIFLVNRSGIGSRVYGTVENVLSLWMWLPAVACIVLECLYILNERGAEPVRYNTVIRGFCMAYAAVSLAVILLLHRVKMSLCPAGYMGALAGLGCIVYIPYSYYQSALVFLDNDHIYELGNLAFASDTLRSGKLPIIDYFSAHALSDTLPSILYGFLNADPDGGLAVPYSGLWDFLGLVVVYLILKKLFRKEYAILFVCIFPLSLGLTKTTSACMMVVLAMICVLEQKGKKAHVIFWLAALAGVLIRYDEGVNLGVGCIAAIICILVLRKDKKCVKQFLLLGVFIAAGALLAYFGYCKITGIHAMRRILEWLSLTADSDSTWALNTLGDTGSPAFFVSYMAVPVCTVSALAAVVAGFVTDRRKPVAAAMAAAFCISGILFIPRTIVLHNLAVGSGRSGVLFNFVHWMAASFAFYVFAVKEKKEGVCFAAWVAAFCMALTAEGVLVTGYVPERNATLYNLSADYAWERKRAVSDDMSNLWGGERILWPDTTSDFCGRFEKVFDLLLDEDETFLDFANVTALYAFVGKERPFYVTQSPSLLTDLRSQQYYLEELGGHKVPLAVIGETAGNSTSMAGTCHNVRYYTIAEYIYRNYRPLLHTGEFAIWCEMDRYGEFSRMIMDSGLLGDGYEMAGYMDNPLPVSPDGRKLYEYHSPELGMTAYIWANYDQYNAARNTVLEEAVETGDNTFSFRGSQFLDNSKGNYIIFECGYTGEDQGRLTVICEDSSDSAIRYESNFWALPGSNSYIIRVSQDYLWFAYNIDTIRFSGDGAYSIQHVRILEGD